MSDGGRKQQTSFGAVAPHVLLHTSLSFCSPPDAPLTSVTRFPGFHLAAGLGSGVTSALLLQPADLLKTRLQQKGHGGVGGGYGGYGGCGGYGGYGGCGGYGGYGGQGGQGGKAVSPSLRHALRHVLHGPHPIRQLWRGTTPSVIRTGLGSAVYFGLLSQMRHYLSPSSSALPKLGNVANLTTGAVARVAAGFLMNPVTVLKVRYESTHYSYTSLAGAARHVVAQEGLRGFFAGFGATAVRDAPYAGLYVLIYEDAKTRLASLSVVVVAAPDGRVAPRSVSSSATVTFVSGVLAAVTATAMTNPFDAIKTRLQLAPGRYRNMLQAARVMLKEEGVRSMFTGLSLRLGRKALSSALTWTVYEEIIRRAEQAIV